MTPAQAKGTGKFFGNILIVIAVFACVLAALTGDKVLIWAGLAFAICAIIVGVVLGLLTAPVLRIIARMGWKKRGRDGKSE